MTDVTAFMAFTRYTVAPSTISKGSANVTVVPAYTSLIFPYFRRSAKTKRRKAGRKGTVEEEEYLLVSITKLVACIKAT